jgi:hypothetical protein
MAYTAENSAGQFDDEFQHRGSRILNVQGYIPILLFAVTLGLVTLQSMQTHSSRLQPPCEPQMATTPSMLPPSPPSPSPSTIELDLAQNDRYVVILNEAEWHQEVVIAFADALYHADFIPIIIAPRPYGFGFADVLKYAILLPFEKGDMIIPPTLRKFIFVSPSGWLDDKPISNDTTLLTVIHHPDVETGWPYATPRYGPIVLSESVRDWTCKNKIVGNCTYEYMVPIWRAPVDSLVPNGILAPYKQYPRTPTVIIAGAMSYARRDYDSFIAAVAASQRLQSIPNFRVLLIGKSGPNSIRDNIAKYNLEKFFEIHENEGTVYKEFWGLTQSARAVFLAHKPDDESYYTVRASAQVPAAISNGVPIVGSHLVAKAYPFLKGAYLEYQNSSIVAPGHADGGKVGDMLWKTWEDAMVWVMTCSEEEHAKLRARVIAIRDEQAVRNRDLMLEVFGKKLADTDTATA